MAKKERWDVISPDGFSIHPIDTYPSLDDAVKAFRKWKKGYEGQGYYSSSNHGRINLLDLEDFCEFKKIGNDR